MQNKQNDRCAKAKRVAFETSRPEIVQHGDRDIASGVEKMGDTVTLHLGNDHRVWVEAFKV